MNEDRPKQPRGHGEWAIVWAVVMTVVTVAAVGVLLYVF
jgi:hypothetical protein